MFGPYFWVAFTLIMVLGLLIGNSSIHPVIGIALVMVLGWIGGRLAAKCDLNRTRK